MATIFVHKVREAAFFHDNAVINNGKAVALLDSRQPVRDDDRCAVAHNRVESLLHLPLRVFVKGTSCLIEKQDAWLTNDSPSDSNSLLLTTREFAAAVTCEDFEAFVELLGQQGLVSPCVNQASLLFELTLIVVLLDESRDRFLDCFVLSSLNLVLCFIIHAQIRDQICLLFGGFHLRLSFVGGGRRVNCFSSLLFLLEFGPGYDRLIDLFEHLGLKLVESCQ